MAEIVAVRADSASLNETFGRSARIPVPYIYEGIGPLTISESAQQQPKSKVTSRCVVEFLDTVRGSVV
jgi:hypothetical protein